MRDSISALTLKRGSQLDQEDRERLAGLEADQQRLQQQISKYGIERQDPWQTTGSLLSNIPADAVLINIARFRPCRFDSVLRDQFHPARYVAWVMPPVGFGNVEIVDLGPAREIDRQVERLRERLIDDSKKLQTVGEPILEAEFREAAQSLSATLIAPLEKYLNGPDELILSPDGLLWTLPWDALLTSDGKYLAEKIRTRYVLSGS